MPARLHPWLGVLALGLALVPGCEALDALGGSGTDTAGGTQPQAEPTKAPSAPAAAAAVPTPGLDTALRHGVTMPPAGGSTYYVDPFVLTMVVEQGRNSALPLTAKKIADGRDALVVETLEPDGLLSLLGLKTGDQLLRVNEQTVGDLPALVPVLAAGGSRLVVELLRDDYAMTLEYRLVGGMAWSRALAAYGGSPAPPVPEPAALPEPLPEESEASEPAPPESEPAPRPGGGALPPKTRPRPSSPTPAPSTGSKPSHVRCTSSTSCEISRQRFDALVSDPTALDKQANIVPAIRNNVQSGYKLKSVRPGTDLHALGFRGGDKITHINGHYLGDDAQAMQLYFKLSATRRFDIRYERGGRSLRKVVRVK